MSHVLNLNKVYDFELDQICFVSLFMNITIISVMSEMEGKKNTTPLCIMREQ